MKFFNFFILAFFICFSFNLKAEEHQAELTDLVEMSLEDLMKVEVSSGSFFKMDKTKTPGYVILFDQNKINNSAARSMHELFDMYAPGVSMSYHFNGSLMGQRGIGIDSNAKTMFMIDGKNINARSHMGYMLPLDVPLMGDMDSVELLQGAGAVQYGSGAINGAVNMITKHGKDYQGFNLTTDYGFIDKLHKLELSYGKKLEKGDLFLYFGTLNADGFNPNPTATALTATTSEALRTITKNNGLQVKKFVDDNYKVTANWNLGNFNLLTQYVTYHGISYTPLGSIYQERGETATPINPANQNMSAVWSHTYLLINPKYNLEFTETDSLEISPSLFIVDIGAYNFKAHQMFETWGQNNANEKEYALKTTFKTTRLYKNAIAVGVSFSQRQFNYLKPTFESQSVPGVGTFAGSTDGLTPISNLFSWLEYAVFFEDVISFTDRFNIAIGMRLDGVNYPSTTIGYEGLNVGVALPMQLATDHYRKFVPRVSMSYNLTKQAVIRLVYQEGFRHPDLANLISGVGGMNMTPEAMKSISANYSQSLSIINRPATIEANMYYNVLQNTIGWKTGTQGEQGQASQTGFANTPGQYASLGGEAIFKYEPFKNSNWGLSYSYSQPVGYTADLQQGQYSSVMEVNQNRNSWVRYPKHIVKTDLSKWFFDNIMLCHAALRYTSAFPDIYTTTVVPTHAAYRSARVQLDLMVKFMINKISKGTSISLYAKNITADQSGLPPWSGNTDDGTLGIGERLYYVSLNVPF